MDEERPYWNMEMETILNTPEMREIQLEKLKVFLRRLYDNAPFYTKQFDELGVVPEKINSFEDFSSAVPLFDKEGLRAMVVEFGGDLLAVLDQIMPVSVDDLNIMATTTGTTGIPTPYPMTWHDMVEVWGEAMVRGDVAGGNPLHDRILFCFALSMVIAGVPTMMGMHKAWGPWPSRWERKPAPTASCSCRRSSAAPSTAGRPSLAEYLIEKCKDQGRDPKDLGLRKLLCGGEPGAGVPEVRNRLEERSTARASSTPAPATASPATTRNTRACTGPPTTWPTTSWWTRRPRNPSPWRTAPRARPSSPLGGGRHGLAAHQPGRHPAGLYLALPLRPYRFPLQGRGANRRHAQGQGGHRLSDHGRRRGVRPSCLESPASSASC